MQPAGCLLLSTSIVLYDTMLTICWFVDSKPILTCIQILSMPTAADL